MRNIFLIDDNAHGQRSIYGASFVDNNEFHDILCHIERLNKDSDFSFLYKADLILIHDTMDDFIDGEFKENSHFAREKIIQFAEENKIPFVCFSDGHNQTGEFDKDGNIVSLKKSEFYERLYYFLKYYALNKHIELRILAFGKNFTKIALEKEVKCLYVKLSKFSDETVLSVKNIIETKCEIALKNIADIAQPALGMDYQDIIDYILENKMSIGEFKTQISNILKSVSTYGKNLYSWE